MKGITLVECLFALSLSMMLFFFIGTFSVITFHHHETQSSWNLLQENTRIASSFLTKNLQKTGFVGCAFGSKNFYLSHPVTSDHHESSDSLSLQYLSESSAILLEPMRHPAFLKVTSTLLISKGDWMLITDCEHAEIFEVAKVSDFQGGKEITLKQSLKYLYAKNSEIRHYFTTR